MFSGTAEKYGAGVSSTLSKNAAVWVEENYLKGDHIESPVSATAGFRLSF
ncbi:autotransporter outer membrane beta-barrel domain-containing protein [Enterobacter cancerogenus]